MVRGLVGPLCVAAGYHYLNGKQGHLPGLMAMIAGALIVESAITKTCPMNALLGIDTREGLHR
jgi:hypothetical protein